MTTPLNKPTVGAPVASPAQPEVALELPPVAEVGDFAHLRALLLGSEIEALRALRERLDDPVVQAQELARVLPEAIAIRAAQDRRLGRALQETVDEALRNSVRRDPTHLTETIFPVLGPAIRKAISTTLLGMVQSLSETLNQGLSIRGLRWRLQAWRSGVPYGEVVLLNTLVYRVEQVALVHREQGVVLAHAVAHDVGAQDSDLVFSMLSAIQSFMEDAFDESGSRLDTVRMGGDLSLWIEENADVVLALVVRGTPPADLRDRPRELLEGIQSSHHQQLADFSGDTTPFAALVEPLEELLESRFHEKSEKTGKVGVLAWLICGLVVLAPVVWLGYRQVQLVNFENFAARVGAIDGVVVTAAGRVSGGFRIVGFRDPLAADPVTLLEGSGLSAHRINFDFEPYQALSPDLVLARARDVLNPPQTVTLALADSTLRVTGAADPAWARRLRSTASFLPGVAALDTSGFAVPEFDRLARVVADLEALQLYAPKGSSELAPGQEPTLARAAALAKLLEEWQESLGTPIQILILGFTDATGGEALNARLSSARAEQVADSLAAAGIAANMLLPVGRGVADASVAPESNQGRYVTFRVLGPVTLREWKAANG